MSLHPQRHARLILPRKIRAHLKKNLKLSRSLLPSQNQFPNPNRRLNRNLSRSGPRDRRVPRRCSVVADHVQARAVLGNGSAAYVVRSAYVTRVLEAMDGLGSGQPVSAAW